MIYCQGPDPETKSPNFVVPPKACDAHCHVFGPAKRFPFSPDRSYTPPDASFETMQGLQKALGIERAVIVQATCHGTDNTAALDAIARSNGRYRGVAIVDDSFSNEDFKTLNEGGIRGIRFSFARHIGNAPDFTTVRRITERVTPFGWHVVIYMEAPDIVEHAETLAELPLPVVIDHMGRVKTEDGIDQEPFQLLLGLLKEKKDFWVKICGAERISTHGKPFHDAVPFAQACIAAAPDRVLWGTDWPHPNIDGYMPNDGDLLDLLSLHASDEKIRRRILVDNPARLYGFSD